MKSAKLTNPSRLAGSTPDDPPDRLSGLLDRFRLRASLFHSGPLCGVTTFEARPGRAFVHILRRGSMQVRHPGAVHVPGLRLDQPTLLLYPRPLHHEFINPPREGSDLTCATLYFDGGDRNPVVSALPDVIEVPLEAVQGLLPTLELLFAETDRPRCGTRLLADRLFEVVVIQLLRWMVDHPARAGVSAGLFAGLADRRIARALVALHRAPGDAWSLAGMAAVAGMSRSAFAESFRRIVGCTPGAYLGDWRLTLAATQLRAGRPLNLIAPELGFASTASLSRAFRQRHRVSPRAWLQASQPALSTN